MRLHLRTLALGMGAAILLTFLFFQQRPVDPTEHNRFIGNLLRIKQLDAEVNRDMLSSQSELLGSYDSFVQKFKDMRMAESAIRQVPSFITGPRKKEMEHAIHRETEILSQKARTVETFKSENAIFRNSFRYFPVLVGQATEAAAKSGDVRLEKHLTSLLRDMLLYGLAPNSDLAGSLNRQIDLLAKDQEKRPALKPILSLVSAHAVIILSVKPRVQKITESLKSPQAAVVIDAILGDYTTFYDRASRINANYRLALYLSSVFLLAFAGDRTVSLMRSRQVLQHANLQLHNAQARYERAARGANDGLWDWDLTSAETYYSPRWKEMLGFAPEELSNTLETWFDRLHPEDRNRVQQEWNDHFANRTPEFESEHRVLHSDGNYRWMLSRGMAVREANGQVHRMAGSQTDITGNKCKDALTGLANRLRFIERLSQIIRDGRRGLRTDYAVLFLDVDRFKVINDSLGHLAGDVLLQQIADRLRACVRSNDLVCRLFGDATIARLGGDEFAVLIERCHDAETAEKITNRVLAEFEKPFLLEGREIISTLSVGVAHGSADYLDAADILRDADIAMYEAKVSGKARSGIFEPGMRARAVDRMEMEADIRSGIEQGQFVNFYQAKVALESAEITGFEALVRWKHPRRGLIPPDQFIPLAEETGLIVPLGYLVLRNACNQMREWQQGPGGAKLSVSVNISGKQFAAPELVERISEILNESGIAASSLDLELTETSVMKNPEAASKILRRLRDLGTGLHMDDFGTGYSSLSYLQRFPFDTIKIDRSFVNGLGNRAESRDIVRTIIDLARSLKMKVVAEGVETGLQAAELKALGCNYGQGFLYSEPVDAKAAGAMIAIKAFDKNAAPQDSSLGNICFV